MAFDKYILTLPNIYHAPQHSRRFVTLPFLPLDTGRSANRARYQKHVDEALTVLSQGKRARAETRQGFQKSVRVALNKCVEQAKFHFVSAKTMHKTSRSPPLPPSHYMERDAAHEHTQAKS